MRPSRTSAARQQSPQPAPSRRRDNARHDSGHSEGARPSSTAKDVNVVRGDDRPQAVRHPR